MITRFRAGIRMRVHLCLYVDDRVILLAMNRPRGFSTLWDDNCERQRARVAVCRNECNGIPGQCRLGETTQPALVFIVTRTV